MYLLYSLPVIFSKIFSLDTLARLRFILHLKMQVAYAMCFTNPIYIHRVRKKNEPIVF